MNHPVTANPEQTMTGQQITGGGEASPPPIACTLTPGGLAARASQWRAIISRAMTGRAELTDGVRLTFRAGPGTEAELRGLAAAESECCPWAGWTVRAAGGQLLLTVRAATADGAATLHTMFAGPGCRPGLTSPGSPSIQRRGRRRGSGEDAPEVP
jgi:hypothetical protein